jgi:hypothetical protein
MKRAIEPDSSIAELFERQSREDRHAVLGRDGEVPPGAARPESAWSFTREIVMVKPSFQAVFKHLQGG